MGDQIAMSDERGDVSPAKALRLCLSREEPSPGLLIKEAARDQIQGQSAPLSFRARSKSSAHVLEQASLETNPAAIAAAIAKKMPARRVCVRRRTISSTSGLYGGDNYGHVGIGIKIHVDAQTGKASISALLAGGPADNTGQIRAGDRLVAVNNITVDSMSVEDITAIILGPPGGIVELQITQECEESGGQQHTGHQQEGAHAKDDFPHGMSAAEEGGSRMQRASKCVAGVGLRFRLYATACSVVHVQVRVSDLMIQ